MADKPLKPTIVEIQLMRGPTTFTGKIKGKVYGGLVSFSGMDPSIPVVWLGGEEYSMLNLTSRKTVLFYDTLSKMLLKTSSLGVSQKGVDMMARVSQSFLIGAKEAEQKMGIDQNKDRTYVLALVGMLFIFVITALVLYLVLNEGITHVSTAVTTVQSATNASHGLLGTGVIPLNSSS